MSTEILCARVVDNIGTQLEGLLQVRRHHGVVDHDQSVGASRMDNLTDPWNIGDLHQWVCGCFKQDQAGLFREIWDDGFGICGVDMVCFDIVVCCKEAEQSVGAYVLRKEEEKKEKGQGEEEVQASKGKGRFVCVFLV